jgi:hypothetical protein
MIHPKQVERFNGSLTELAENLGNLQYDVLAEFLGLLALKIEQDAKNDNERGRAKLGGSLKQWADDLKNAEDAITQAWAICQPYVKDQAKPYPVKTSGNQLSDWEPAFQHGREPIAKILISL